MWTYLEAGGSTQGTELGKESFARALRHDEAAVVKLRSRHTKMSVSSRPGWFRGGGGRVSVGAPPRCTFGLIPAAGSVEMSTPLNGLFFTVGCGMVSSG